MGKIKMISISNNKKINKILKNWIENGERGLAQGLNPHSKEKSFSFFIVWSLLSMKIRLKIIVKINIINIRYIKKYK